MNPPDIQFNSLSAKDGEIKKALHDLSPEYDLAWLNGLFLRMEDGKFIVRFVHPHFALWFHSHKRDMFEGLIDALTVGKAPEIFYDGALPFNKAANMPSPQNNLARENQEDYFADFITNEKNFMALGAVKSACGNDPCQFFPLVLTGESGTGKTHLLNAMHLSFQSRNRRSRLDKTARFCATLSADSLSGNNFWKSYEALILDNLQEIIPENAWQDMLASWLDEAGQSKRPAKVIFAFTGSASEMRPMRSRLRSLLMSGLLVELKAPDLDGRLRWLEKINRDEAIGLPREHVLFLGRLGAPIPTLKGLLHKIDFFVKIYHKMPSLKDIEEMARQGGQKTPQSWRNILVRASTLLNISIDDIMGSSRKPDCVLARQLAMYVCRRELGYSYPELGRLFGGKDHSTVMHSIKKIERLAVTDKETRNLLTEMEKSGEK